MRFKSFVWPHNPRVYSITFERKLAAHKIPFGRHVIQSLGQTRRVLKGEGEFVGEGAYDTFKELASLFYEETPGVLVHPVWMTTTAWFAALELRQAPRRDYVAYSFEFWEVIEGAGDGKLTAQPVESAGDGGEEAQQAQWHTVVRGDTLWALSRRYGTALSRIIQLNPGIRNPNLIYPGQKVRVK
ncbi:MAG: LysM peptidoglycan-binding domain-containing protein [Clostridiales bacterium]|nr:LysM peptidoglycan-binding domain-containing protein [Clostridiales bacterium]